jgi:hypothetical protein
MAAAPGANICSNDISRELIRSVPEAGTECSGAPNPAPACCVAIDGEDDALSRWIGCGVGGRVDVRCRATGLEAIGTDVTAGGAGIGTFGTGRLGPAPSSGAVSSGDVGPAAWWSVSAPNAEPSSV